MGKGVIVTMSGESKKPFIFFKKGHNWLAFPRNVMVFFLLQDENVFVGISSSVVIYVIYMYILLSGVCFINQFVYGWIYPGIGLYT